MENEIEKLYKELETASNIIIASHLNPDMDAYCSSLLAYGFLKAKWPNKNVVVNIQGANTADITFLNNADLLGNSNMFDLIKEIKPDLFLMVDANNFLHFSGTDGDVVREYMHTSGIRTAIIDHHPQKYKEDKVDFYINRECSSASEEVYRLFAHDFGFEVFEGAPQIAMLGILADTNRFMYPNPNHKETFKTVSELLESGVVIEELWNRIFKLKTSYTPVFAELLKNIGSNEDYNYSYISVEFAKSYVDKGGNWEDFSNAYYLWVDQYIRYFEPNTWGYVIVPDFSEGLDNINKFRGSFRALNNIDTSVFARVLGGGGHKLASGFNVEANNHETALEEVNKVIAENR